MATRGPTSVVDEHEFYPIHEEDDVPEIPFHEQQTRYLRDALTARFPDLYVTGNVCIYWEQGNTSLYLAPDVFVAEGRPLSPSPRVHLLWQDPPVLFVAEIGSRSTFRVDEGPKLERYAQGVQASEYLYANPPESALRLWRLTAEGYKPVAPEPNGRFRSEQLGLEFGLGDDFLWLYTPEGDRLRTYEESERELEEAQVRVRVEARRREDADQARQEAEARAAAETRQREDAERCATQEREQREALERRLAQLQAELDLKGD